MEKKDQSASLPEPSHSVFLGDTFYHLEKGWCINIRNDWGSSWGDLVDTPVIVDQPSKDLQNGDDLS